MRLLRSSLAISAALLVCGAARAEVALVNPSFEDGLTGWTTGVGARNGNGTAESRVEVDREVAKDGSASLRLAGDGGTVVWSMLSQPAAVRAGERVTLRVAARCEGVRREGNQYPNCNGLLAFQDAAGRRLGLVTTDVLGGDRDWIELGLDVIAPAGTATAEVGVFHSMTGTAWFDDVRLTTAPTEPFDGAARGAAFDALAAHLRRSYSFWGLPGKPEPAALFARHREKALAAADLASFAGVLREMLAELDDVHVWLDTAVGRVGTAGPGKGAQFDARAVLARLVGEPLVKGRNVLAGWMGEGEARVAYLLVGSFSLPEDELALLRQALEAFAEAPRLVIDVRPNGGGDERQAMGLAALLTIADLVYARSRWRDATLPGDEGLGPPLDRVLPRAAAGGRRLLAQVAVLSGPGCVSSTEGFLLMCKALPGVTVVGQPSRGASGNPGAFVVLPGLTVWASRWRSYGLDDVCIEGAGVQPDVVVDPGPKGPTAEDDPVLDRALALLRE